MPKRKSKSKNQPTEEEIAEYAELAEKVQAALLAIEAVREDLEAKKAADGYLDSCALAAEGMETLACDLGFGVMNGVLVPA